MEQQPATFIPHPWVILAAILSLGTVGQIFGPGWIACEHPAPGARARAFADIAVIYRALDDYAMSHGGHYPDALEALMTPDENGLRCLSHKRVPRDPWQREYVYERGASPNVKSLGRDGLPGGTGEDADLAYRSMAYWRAWRRPRMGPVVSGPSRKACRIVDP